MTLIWGMEKPGLFGACPSAMKKRRFGVCAGYAPEQNISLASYLKKHIHVMAKRYSPSNSHRGRAAISAKQMILERSAYEESRLHTRSTCTCMYWVCVTGSSLLTDSCLQNCWDPDSLPLVGYCHANCPADSTNCRHCDIALQCTGGWA